MQLPGPPSLLFLVYLLLFLPWAAVRSAQRLRAGAEAAGAPARRAVWTSTLVSLAILFAMALFTARSFDYDVFAVPPLGWRDVGLSAVALGAAFLLRAALRAVRGEEERQRSPLYRIAPREPVEWALWLLSIGAAAVAEEAAYRGVGVQILWYSLGSQTAAILICALAFAVAHALQGWTSGVVIFVLALVMHGLVALTGTLVLAMVVHALYDLVAGWLIAREARRLPAA